MRAVLLSGEHPTLPHAELRAVLQALGLEPVTEPLGPRVAVVNGPDDALDAALGRLALAREWMEPVGHGAADAAGLAQAADAAGHVPAGPSSVAVRSIRLGEGCQLERPQVERGLGAALAQAGRRIDLRRPDETLAAWFDPSTLVYGWRRGTIDRSRFERRRLEARAHFSPVSLHPRTAAALVNMAAVPPGRTVHDPFCGTGGIVLEAALAGYRASGSDLDPWMVQGTLQSLADDGPEPLDSTVFQADVADVPERIDQVEGIVTDMPYGRAASTDREDLRALYARAFGAFTDMLAPGCRAVVGHADATLVPDLAPLGLELLEVHEQYVHGSLTRRFAVVKKM